MIGTLQASLTLCCCLLASSVDDAYDAISMVEFNELKPKWPQLVGADFTVEGRYSLLSNHLLRMTNCDLHFTSGREFPKFIGRSRTVKVSGKIARKNGRVYFAVDSIQEIPSDLDRYYAAKANIDRSSAPQWYDLANWAARRSRFYNDPKLRDESRDAYAHAVAIERRLFADDDSAGLFALAAKVQSFDLTESLQWSLNHEACQILWDKIDDNENALGELAELSRLITKHLAGSQEPLEKPQEELRRRYLKDPLDVYRNAAQTQRRMMHRLFFSEVALKRILLQVGDDGLMVADRIEAELPELQSVADTYRKQEIKKLQSNVATMTRRQMLSLSEHLRQQESSDQAQKTILLWLQAEEKRLRLDGPNGLIELAEEYIDLLDDETQAAELLKEAARLVPDSEVITEKLSQLGYQQKDGEWLTPAEARALPNDPLEVAMRQGRVVAGMTRTHVKTALGEPNSIARIGSSGRMTEVWTYGDDSLSGLVVHFQRRGTSEPKVIRLSKAKRQIRD